MTGIVIIGAGQGAGQAAANFRQAGYEGELMILGEEPFPPYQRPPLSKQYLSGEMPLEKIFVRAEKFYADQNIELRTNTRVISIDPDSKTIETASGEKIGYEKLLIATGSRPRTLDVEGSELTGIHYLRTLSDVDAIRDAMTTAANLVIVGGGYIGLEFASVAVAAGLNVTLVEMEQRILQRVTTEEMSDYYHRLHTERGLNILTNTSVSGFTGYDHVSKVHCSDSSIDADLVIVGIGILPNIELAEDAGIECDNGILVDTRCRTSAEDVYAIGDCTNHQNSLLNRRLRLESVPNAMEAARVAVSNMLGVEKIILQFRGSGRINTI